MGSSPAHIFAEVSASVAQPKAELLTDITDITKDILMYPFLETVTPHEKQHIDVAHTKSALKVLGDDFTSLSHALIGSYEAHEAPSFCYDAKLAANADLTAVGDWLERIGSELGRTKKRLLMPARL